MDARLSFFRNRALLYLLVAAALVAAGYLFFAKSEPPEELVVVERGSFVQEVSVSGKVVAVQDVDLGFSQSGRIAAVYAVVGDRVEAGAALVEMENSDLSAGVLQKQAALEREQASLRLLEEGTRPEEVEIARSEVASNEVVLAQAEDALVEAIQDAFTTSDDAVRNVLDTFIDNPRTDPQLDFLVNDAQLETRIEGNRSLVENMLLAWQGSVQSLAASPDLGEAVSLAEGNLSRVALLLADANAALNKAVPTGVTTQSVIDGYKTDVAAARSAVNGAISSLTSSVTAERNATTALETSRRNLVLKEAGTRASDVAAQQAQVRGAEADLANARAQLAKTIIRAPFTGIVTKMDFKVGSIASANTAGAAMVSEGVYQIESYVPEVNIALIEVGDEAAVTLDAYGPNTVFEAAVESIDPAETVRDGVSTYRTILEFAKSDPRVRSGMTANVVITTDEREGIVSVPVGVVSREGGRTYVFVMEGEEIAERDVTLGMISSRGTIEIVSGLSEGDLVVP